jgi:1-phosphofructokinase
MADLAREPLRAALHGGLDLVKVSDEELRADAWADGESIEELAEGARRISAEGADIVLVSRAADPALLLHGDHLTEVEGPRLHAVEPHGAGDAMFGALGVCVGSGMTLAEAVRYSVAAGAANVMRHGLGSGRVEDIERLLPQIRLRESDAGVGSSTDARFSARP